jgi:hypothetical protein
MASKQNSWTVARRVVQQEVPPMVESWLEDRVEPLVEAWVPDAVGTALPGLLAPTVSQLVEDQLGNIELNPSIVGAAKRVSTATAMLALPDLTVGENVFVDNRKCNFRFVTDQRGKYYRIFGHATPHNNRLSISNTALGFPDNTMPPGSTIEILARVPLESLLPLAQLNILVYDGAATRAIGFSTVSSQLQFGVQTSGGFSGVDQFELQAAEDEFGNPLRKTNYTVLDLPQGRWIRLRLVTTTTVTLASSGIRFGVYYNTGDYECVDYREIRITRSTGETRSWNFIDGLAAPELPTATMVLSGTAELNDVELQGNGYNLIEQTSPYRLFSVQPVGGYVTPENLGAVRSANPHNLDPSLDATAAIQAAHDNYLPLRIDGCYLILGRDRKPGENFRPGIDITHPYEIRLDGSSDGFDFQGIRALTDAYAVTGTSEQAPSPDPSTALTGEWSSGTGWSKNGVSWTLGWDAGNSRWYVTDGEHEFHGPTSFGSGTGNPVGVYTAQSPATGTLVVSKAFRGQLSSGTVGCLYTGRDPVDLFRIFTSGFNLVGGLIYVANTRYRLVDNPNLTDYHTLTPYYVPPKVFTYYHYFIDIIGGYLETNITGDDDEVAHYNAGHIGRFLDNSRWPESIEKVKPVGFAEAHSLKAKLRCKSLYAYTYETVDEPFQDFSSRLKTLGHYAANPADKTYNTGSHNGWIGNQPVNLGPGVYAVNSPSDYTIGTGRAQRFSIRWGTSQIRNILVRWTSSADFWEFLDAALQDAGFPTGVTFRATSLPSGTNQSFRIVSNQSSFEIRTYRGSTAAWHDVDVFGWYCKTGMLGMTNASRYKLDLQPGRTLGTSGDPVQTGLDIDHSELGFPCVTVQSGGYSLDLTTVDIGRFPDSNQISVIDYGDNEYVGAASDRTRRFSAHQINGTPTSSGIDLKNPSRLIYTNVVGSTGTGSFIGPLENILYYAHRRATATIRTFRNLTGAFDFSYPAPATGRPEVIQDDSLTVISSGAGGTGVGVFENIFTDELLGLYVLYNEGFNPDLDFVEIEITNFSQYGATPSVFGHYLEWGPYWTPKRMQVMQVASTNSGSRMYDMAQMTRQWIWTGTLTTFGNTSLLLRLIGCKNKLRRFNLLTWQAVNRNFRNMQKPYLTIGGGARIYNTTEFEGLKIKGPDESYRSVVPQPSPPMNPTNEQLRQALLAAGIFY